MDKQTIVLTRKIQVYLDCDDADKRKEYYKTLFEWQDLVFRSANLVMTHQFVQENIKDLLYLTDDTQVKLADNKKDELGILKCSRMGTTYQVLSKYFKGRINTDILSNINVAMTKAFNTDRLDYWKGQKSLRNFKKTMPIPFSGKQLKLEKDEHNRDFKFVWFKIPFRTYLGKDLSDKRVLLQRALAGQIKICGSALQIIRGKMFLLVTLEMPKKQYDLQEHTIAEASLSIEHPITVTVQKDHFQIGNKEEFLYRRIAIQSSRSRIQRAAAYNRGGKGRKKKLKCLDSLAIREKNYVESRLHLYSRKLIDTCIKCQAGTLLLLNQSSKEEVAKDDEFILRNWSYYGLIEKIKYKANLAGIKVIIE